LATSDAIPVFCLLEAGSVATSPLTPVACKAQNLRARDRGVQSASYVILVVCMHVRWKDNYTYHESVYLWKRHAFST
jgi:hypothetical protein